MRILIERQGRPVGKPMLLTFSVGQDDWEKTDKSIEWTERKPSQEALQRKALEHLEFRIKHESEEIQSANAVLLGEYNSTNHTVFPTGFYTSISIAIQLYKV